MGVIRISPSGQSRNLCNCGRELQHVGFVLSAFLDLFQVDLQAGMGGRRYIHTFRTMSLVM